MEDANTQASSTTPTRHSTCLAEKLKKLMQTETVESPPMEVTMEINIEEQKKRAHAITPFTGTTMTSSKTPRPKNPRKSIVTQHHPIHLSQQICRGPSMNNRWIWKLKEIR